MRILRLLRSFGVGVGRLSFLNFRRGTATAGAAVIVSASVAAVLPAVIGVLVLNRVLGLAVVSEGPLLLLLSWLAA